MEELVTQAWFLEHMGAPDAVQLDANVAVWSQALVQVPTTELVPMFYKSVEFCKTSSPRPGDVLKAWRENLASQPAQTFQELEEEKNGPALPMSTVAGPGREAWEALGQRRQAVVCSCPAKNGFNKPAQLTDDALLWVCADGQCDFTWAASMTDTAPPPATPGPMTDRVGEVNRAKAEHAQHSKALTMFAADAEVDLDACTPQQFIEFRMFMAWWRDLFPTSKITHALMIEQYPNFQNRPKERVF